MSSGMKFVKFSTILRNFGKNKGVPVTIFKEIDCKTFSTNSKQNSKKKLGLPESYLYGLSLASGLAVGLLLTYKKYTKENLELSELVNKLNAFQSELPNVEAIGGGIARRRMNFIADVVDNTAMSVVSIDIKDTKRRDFFTGHIPTHSNGSGFIIEEDGLILTNAHVVLSRPTSIIQVKLFDGSVHRGYVENIDTQFDVATIRIKVDKKLPVMKLGSSSELRPGEWVIAMGSPLSLKNTITAGVVSSVHRTSNELGLINKDMDYIQTDAAITYGNSGGPLVNLDGEAIGINAMKVASGISFAVPIDYAKAFLKKIKGEKSEGPPKDFGTTFINKYLGLTIMTIHQKMYQDFGIKELLPESGVFIWAVIVGSPSDIGGLKPGDVITHCNGNPVKDVLDVYSVLDYTSTLHLKVWRQNKEFMTTVIAEELM